MDRRLGPFVDRSYLMRDFKPRTYDDPKSSQVKGSGSVIFGPAASASPNWELARNGNFQALTQT